jgi:hypothetical protein
MYNRLHNNFNSCSELLIGRDHTLREQRDLRMAQQKLRNLEDMRARLPTIKGFEPD